MSKKHNRPNTIAKAESRKVSLRGIAPTSFSDSSVSVDEAAGIIKNVALMTVGEAKGHGFDLDQTSIEQLIALANSQPDGVRSRFKHPAITETPEGGQSVADSTGSMVGRVKNVRLVGNQARGDVYLGSYAEIMPGLGDVKEYLLRHAKDDPAGVGMSAMFEYTVDPVVDDYGTVLSRPARLSTLDAIDFVDVPAANPRGLLAAGWQDPNPKDQAVAPIPVSTPEWPVNAGDYLTKMVKDGPQTLGGIASQFSGRLEAMRAACSWLCSNGFAEVVPGNNPAWKATPKGTSKAAMNWK